MSSLQLHSGAKVSAELTSSGRIDGLDSLRAVLAVLVVLLHASMPYMLSPFPGLAWPVHDDNPSGWVDAVGWWADSFVMPTFLLMSGFFAAQLMQRKGAKDFLKNRFQRVLRPLALGMIVLLPIELYLWLLAWVGQGEIAAVKLRSLKINSPHGDHLWGLSHLWFLEYLLLYSLLAWCVVRAIQWWTTLALATPSPPLSTTPCPKTLDGGGEGRGEGPTLRVHHERHTVNSASEASVQVAITMAGGLTAGLIMCWFPRVLIGFHHGWWPHPANFICFGLIFAAGWWLARRHQRGANVTAGCELQAAAGLLLLTIALPGLREFAALRDADAVAPWTTAIPFGLAGWLSAIGWWGVFLKYLNRPPARCVCYLAESSFWMYLIHHPLVALLQINLAMVNWSSGLKFVTASAGAIAVSLAMYECLVRRTRLGALLNGRWQQTAPQPSVERQSVTSADLTRRAA